MEIHYFSGTGNTRLLAERLSDRLECKVIPLGLLESQDVILMYPIYAMGTPKHVIEWIKQLPSGSGEVYIIKTAGDFLKINSQASFKIINLLKAKGYRIIYDRVIVMPSNIFMKFPKEVSAKLYEVAKHKIDLVYDDIINHKERLEKSRPITRLIASAASYMESHYGGPAFARSLKTTQACTKCGIWVDNCPVLNIGLKDRIEFGHKCVFCMKCVYNCPEHAIYSKSLKFAVLESYNVDEFKALQVADVVFKGYFKHYIKYIKDDSL